jgi:hypothetical protein
MNRAAVCTALTGEDPIEVRDWDVPPLGPTSLRIAVAATSVNFPDVLIVGGESQLGAFSSARAPPSGIGDVLAQRPVLPAQMLGDALHGYSRLTHVPDRLALFLGGFKR